MPDTTHEIGETCLIGVSPEHSGYLEFNRVEAADKWAADRPAVREVFDGTRGRYGWVLESRA